MRAYGVAGFYRPKKKLRKKNNRCTSENEGAEIAVLPRVNIIPLKMTLNFTYTNSDRFALPGAVYQCVGGKKVFKDFAFVRY